MNFFHRHQPPPIPAVEPRVAPVSLTEEEKATPDDPVQPIHIDEAQYLQLTRALHPEATPVLEDPARDAVLPNPFPRTSADSLPPSGNLAATPEDHPPGTPIV